MPRLSRAVLVALTGLVVVCVAVYWSGLGGGFLFDDYQTIVNNPALRTIGTPSQNWLAIALSSDSGLLRRPLSMLSFGFNVALFGASPLAFKAINLAIHLANGLLVFAIGRRLAGRLVRADAHDDGANRDGLALLATALWLLHPLHVSSVVYVVQRMTELATLFTLAGLFCYVDGRVRSLRGEPALGQALVGICLFGVLAAFSKENGVLIFGYAFVVEAICFRFETANLRERRIVQGFFAITVALPIALAAIFLATHPHWAESAYSIREFTLQQRLMTEARILCDYLVWIFVPNPAWMSMFHDDITASSGLLEPVSTLVALVFLAALVALAWRRRSQNPGFAFAVAWFLVGQSMESTIVPLELVFEHRNYLPMAGVWLGVVCAAAPWLERHASRRSLAFAGGGLVVAFAALTGWRATNWGDPLRLALTDARTHPRSARCQYEAARLIVAEGLKSNRRDAAEQEAVPYLERAASLDPAQLHAPTSLVLIEARKGPVPESTLADLAARLRNARSFSDAGAFMDMLVSVSAEPLSLTPTDVERLVDAALTNPHFPPQVRARILNNYGAYQFNIVHDNDRAISLTKDATNEDPTSPYFELNLAKIALALGKPDDAQRHLQAAESLDKAHFYTQDIAQLRARIMQQASG